MAYFKNLFPELQDDRQQIRKPAAPGGPVPYEQREQYPSNTQELFSGYSPTPESLSQDNARAAQIKPAPQQEGPNVKAEYQKAAQAKQRGYNESLKLLTDVDADIEATKFGSEGIVNITPKDESDLKGVIEKVGKKAERPSRLADDLRVIASRATVSPAWSQKLLKAATLLDQADKADQYIENLKKPGGVLALTKQEAAQSAQRLQGDIQRQQQGLEGAGSLRMQEQAPNLQRDMAQQQRLQEFAGGQPAAGDDAPDFNSVLVANGWTKGDFFKRALALQSTLGLNMSQRIAPSVAGMAIASMLRGMGSAGQAILVQMVKDSKRGQQTPGGGSDPNRKPGASEMPDPYEARIRDREIRFDEAFRELKQLKAFNSMWDVVFYVLFSLMMGPGPAAILFTNKGRRGQLEFELEQYRHEIESLSRRSESHQRMQESARRWAADNDLAERRFSHQVEKDEFYMNLRQKNPAGKDPVLDNLMGGYRMWQDVVEEAEKVLNNEFSFNEAEIRAARQKRDRAIPMRDLARNNILKYQSQQLAKAQGGGEVSE